ncbi:FUSC family protein [Arcicella rigui]|uniref:FUSC family membrane protein n=1 Tax=Arcicella rigui TaxID=797020 RepID=A0ABU5Q6L4_9BACT|nr:FUSC family membrane protein [Arcicella rigui]MEA5138238.1 FUSC family membrane protein [Arcicella rigui]
MTSKTQQTTNEIKNFVWSHYFGDGLRVTIGVVLPSLILFQYHLQQIGITISLGALCASIADTPGPITHRRNAMLVSTVLVSVVAFIVGFASNSIVLLGFVVVAFSFIFSMLHVYGNRSSLVGTAALLVLTLGLSHVRSFAEIAHYSLYILTGGLWYSLLSLSLYKIMPYRLAQQTLGECVIEVANFMRIKSGFYKAGMDYDENYKKLLLCQATVNDKQNAVRELLFKSREIVRESTQEGRFLVIVFVDTMDLFEQALSTFYSYQTLHQQFDDVGILKHFEEVLIHLSDQLEEIGLALKADGKPNFSLRLPREIRDLKQEIEILESSYSPETFSESGIQALKSIDVNIENIYLRIRKINSYFKDKKANKLIKSKTQSAYFISHEEYSFDLFRENLNLKSGVFRHAIRVSSAMLLGFLIAQFSHFLHSNWILLTIIVIMKPAFSLTKERNYHRLIGTIIGVGIGMFILAWVENENALFGILLFCILGTFIFIRKNYIISVLFMTPFILILYDFQGLLSKAVFIERVYDTLIGGSIAFMASHFLLPSWEHQKLRTVLIEMIEANLAYYHQVSAYFFGQQYDKIPYKIIRKEVYVRSANLASAFQRMFSEPKSKQLSIKEVHKFSVLNHLMTSYIATLALYITEHCDDIQEFEKLQLVAMNTEKLMTEAMIILDSEDGVIHQDLRIISLKNTFKNQEELMLISEQFIDIQKVAFDIYKISEKIKV